MEKKPGIETEVCGRCGGGGHYSYNQTNGTTCFGCGGTGRRYTKRGMVAKKFLTELRSKRADQVVVGDVVWDDNFFGAEWMTVTAVGPYVESVLEKREDGHYDAIGTRERGTQVDGVGVKSSKERGLARGLPGETLVRVRQSKEQIAATLEAAVTYQATLTKTGKPRKV